MDCSACSKPFGPRKIVEHTCVACRNMYEAIEDLAREVPGDFCVIGSAELKSDNDPGLNVEGVGCIGLPVNPLLVKAMIKKSKPAPFGRGEQTLRDKSVRNTHQLDSKSVQLTGKGWQQFMAKMTSKIKLELGIAESAKVTAELYKLLIYPKGGHFKQHRDTEKASGMFGSLIIVLPSEFFGGDLVVKHNGRSKTFRPSLHSKDLKLSYAAFYADCQHTVEPVTKGYRIALAYNLLHVGGQIPCSPPDFFASKKFKAICQGLKEWQSTGKMDGCDVSYVVYLFDHKYSRVGLSTTGLKAKDALVKKVLRAAIQKGGLKIGIEEVMIDSEASGYGGGFGCDDIEWEEENIIAHHSFMDLPISEEHVLHEDGLESLIDSEEIEEATGNEGATAERQYSGAGLVLVLLDRVLPLMMEQLGLPKVVKQLSEALVKKSSGEATDDIEDVLLSKEADIVQQMLQKPNFPSEEVVSLCKAVMQGAKTAKEKGLELTKLILKAPKMLIAALGQAKAIAEMRTLLSPNLGAIVEALISSKAAFDGNFVKAFHSEKGCPKVVHKPILAYVQATVNGANPKHLGKVLALMTSWADENSLKKILHSIQSLKATLVWSYILAAKHSSLGMQLGRELLNEILSSGDGAPVPSAEFVQLLEAAAASKCARSASKCLKLGVSWMGAGQETRRVASPLWCSAPAPSVEPQVNFAEKLVKALHGLATCFEAKELAAELEVWVKMQTQSAADPKFVLELCKACGNTNLPVPECTLHHWLGLAFQHVCEQQRQNANTTQNTWMQEETNKGNLALYVAIVQHLEVGDSASSKLTVLSSMAKMMLRCLSDKDLLAFVGPSMLKLCEASCNRSVQEAATGAIVDRCVELLEQRVSVQLPVPSFASGARIRCACRDCAPINAFLASNAERTTFSGGKERRKHVHRQLDGCQIDCSHISSGSVMTITKRRSAYQKALKQRQLENDMLRKLVALDLPSAKRQKRG